MGCVWEYVERLVVVLPNVHCLLVRALFLARDISDMLFAFCGKRVTFDGTLSVFCSRHPFVGVVIRGVSLT